jgi:peptidoglycan/LPS O-acetylase OafA/YrhL
VKSPSYLRSVEGARGIAALGILAFHLGVLNPYSWLETATSRLWLGVPLFFVISGFLLYRPFASATILGTSRPSLRRYGRARVLRIVPAYWVALTVSVVQLRTGLWTVSLLAGALAMGGYAWFIRSRGTAIISLSLLGLAAVCLAVARPTPSAFSYGVTNYLLVFLQTGKPGLLRPAWSLCVEVAFYAALPLLAIVADRWARGATAVGDRAIRVAMVLSLTIPIGALYNVVVGTNGTYRNLWPAGLPACIDEFGIGMLLAVAMTVWPRIDVRTSRLLIGSALLLGLVANLFYYDPTANNPYASTDFEFSRLMSASFALVFASVLMRDEQTLVGRVLGSRALVGAGTISYGLFLWHWVLINQLYPTRLWSSPLADLALILGLTVIVATVSWRVVEQPILRLKNGGLPGVPRREPRPSPSGRLRGAEAP